MSSKIISGKPGSGKSYYCVWMIAQDLIDWARYEIANGKAFPRLLLCNIPLNISEVNEYVSDQVGKEIDVSKYILQLDDDDFDEPVQRSDWDGVSKNRYEYWWDRFPENALIVIDEVHKYLGDELEKSWAADAVDYSVSFRNWFAEHRHKGQDVTFLTQDPGNISVQIRRIADKCHEITNAKNINIPFPISIPMSDIDVVRESWGINTQYFIVNTGIYSGSRCKFNKSDVTRHFMDPRIFKLYKTHTLSNIDSDRPKLELGKFGSVIWFIRRHWFHITMKILTVIFCAWGGYRLLITMPFVVGKGFTPSVPSAPVHETSPSQESRNEKKVDSSLSPAFLKERNEIQSRYQRLLHENEALKTALSELERNQSEIKAIFPGGVLTASGKKYRPGETLKIDGKEETILIINVKHGIVRFVSGKEIEL